MFGPFEFETEIDASFLDYPITAKITYKATPAQSEGRYYTTHGFDVEVTHTEYYSYGCAINAEGKLWDKLEEIALERAEEHFLGNSEAA